ncbi:MAG: rubredoxin [Hyphomicrobiales bacterium]|nr:MAG: rubredoxin [Hyphomicrobiales bacterium]
MEKWQCTNQDCDPYIYDPSLGDINTIDEDNPIPPGVAFQNLPDDWICHVCGDPKSHFIPLGEWVKVEVPA